MSWIIVLTSHRGRCEQFNVKDCVLDPILKGDSLCHHSANIIAMTTEQKNELNRFIGAKHGLIKGWFNSPIL